mmetsp:Transcript_71269/g.202055  ORF Transcript_71269/g.202055 Transcript_71269/m.202055 type:complete len:127 (-) Transcript_71269:3029-3409(-)
MAKLHRAATAGRAAMQLMAVAKHCRAGQELLLASLSSAPVMSGPAAHRTQPPCRLEVHPIAPSCPTAHLHPSLCAGAARLHCKDRVPIDQSSTSSVIQHRSGPSADAPRMPRNPRADWRPASGCGR